METSAQERNKRVNAVGERSRVIIEGRYWARQGMDKGMLKTKKDFVFTAKFMT